MKIYLASQSIRRVGILKRMKVPFQVVPSSYIERNHKKTLPEKLVLLHAAGKARKAVLPKSARWVLGADTIVCHRRKIFGKPKSAEEAFKMLRSFSGSVHEVYTGVALWDRKLKRMHRGFSKTSVQFRRLSDTAIKNYLSHINPFDKAGSYAIQKKPRIVQKIEGSHSNVVGLPVELVREMMREALS